MYGTGNQKEGGLRAFLLTFCEVFHFNYNDVFGKKYNDSDNSQIEDESAEYSMLVERHGEAIEEANVWRDKYIASLEEQKAMAKEIGETAAKAAVEQLAAKFATKEDLSQLRTSLDETKKQAALTVQENQYIRMFLVKSVADLKSVPVGQVAKELDSLMMGGSTESKKRKSIAVHK